MSYHAIKGMNDILPTESPLWASVENKARTLFSRYGYQEIRTPIVEEKILFARTLGETTSVVEKEMYDFQDKKGKWLVLRPEGTAGVVRAFVESHLAINDPLSRFYYIGPMYRYEQPQKGRYRQFHQIGVEVFGIASPLLDAEVIHMGDQYFKALGLDLTLEINSLGCPLCRPKFAQAFLDYLMAREKELCHDCHRRMKKNPFRALDCKEEGCRKATEEAPSIQEFLCEACEKNFDQVLEGLGTFGTSYKINTRIVRGLDYYLRTTFEFTTSALGAQNAVCGGGRYDGLVHLLDGPNVPGFGFAIGEERLVELLQQQKGRVAPAKEKSVFIIPMGEPALKEAIKAGQKLRQDGVAVEIDYEGRSLKSGLRRADRIQATHALILGEDELKK
ncbi:MAG: histidine--tRNA ligase, partial [bacterium]|nr:histidine--tRNA ligase [bacterium]